MELTDWRGEIDRLRGLVRDAGVRVVIEETGWSWFGLRRSVCITGEPAEMAKVNTILAEEQSAREAW